MKYLIVIEKANGNYSAYSPDLPGCVATGKTIEAAKSRMKAAMAFHLEGLAEDGIKAPKPLSRAEYVEVA